MVPSDEGTPTLGLMLVGKSTAMRLFVLHRATITRITVGILKSVRNAVFQGIRLGLKILLRSNVNKLIAAR